MDAAGSHGAPAASADDERCMGEALRVARAALALGEPPVGACVVHAGQVLAVAHNGVIGGPDATAHAEILAIRAACRRTRAPRLADCSLYATVEPCPMCLAACHYAGIGRVVFGASLADLHGVTGDECFGAPLPGIALRGGVRAAECQALLAEWAAGRAAATP